MENPLTGKTALVTGASRGIGRAIALKLGRQGATVVVNYLTNRDAAEAVVAEISAAGGAAVAIRADLAEVAQINLQAAGRAERGRLRAAVRPQCQRGVLRLPAGGAADGRRRPDR